MNKNPEGPPQKLAERYFATRREANASELIVPRPRIYRLSQEADWLAFQSSLRTYPGRHGLSPWSSQDPKEIMLEAIGRNYLVDRFDEQLTDIARSKRPKGYFDGEENERGPRTLRRYINLFDKPLFDRPQSKVVVEYPWKSGKGGLVVFPEKEPLYEIIHSRDNPIIPRDLQQNGFRKLTVGIAGMGVGTSLADALLKAGVENFVVADGGVIQFHDFNRLPGAAGDKVGMNHAIHWAQMALELNPYLNITCIPQNLGNGEKGTYPIRDFIGGLDIVLEEMDNIKAKIQLREAARDREESVTYPPLIAQAGQEVGLPVLMATDVAMGSIIDFQPGRRDAVIFPSLTDDSRRQLDSDQQMGFEEATEVAIELVGEEAAIWRETVNHGYWSQTGAAAAASEVGVVKTIMKLLQGEPIPPRQKYLLGKAS